MELATVNNFRQSPFFRKILFISGLILFLIFGITAAATAEDSVQGEQEFFLDTIKVTAQKKTEDVQDVPISMSVISDMFIEDAGIKNIKELTFYTPNLYPRQSTNQNMLTMRGISAHSVSLNTPVGLFVDNIGYPLTFMQNPDLVDIERIEILRGPQGTLYGRNTESGAVNIITKQPDNNLRGRIFTEPAFYDARGKNIFYFKTGASVSGPIIKDRLFFGGAVQYEKTDGYMKNIHNEDEKSGKLDRKNLQGKLRWTPNNRTDINFVANGYESDDGYSYIRYKDGPSASDQYETNWDGANEWKDKNNGQALKVKYSADAYNIESITTRNSFLSDFINDGEFGAMVMPDQVWEFEDTVYSQEFRLSAPDSADTFSWIAGIYGFTEEVDVHAEYFGKKILTDYKSKGYAFFGQGTYTFFKRLHLTAGLRYDHQSSDGDQKSVTTSSEYSADIDHSEWLPKVSVSYDIDKSVMVYTTVARGLLAGGYDYAFATNSDTLTFKPEFSWNYEVGTKTAWLQNRLMLNAALFYIKIEDKQVEDFINNTPIRKITNAGKASSKGFEIELTARPYKGWQIFGGVGYSDAEFDEWVANQADGSTYDFKGKKLPNAPAYTYNGGVQYNHTSGLFTRADMTGVSGFYTNAKNTESGKVDGYRTFNLKLGYEMKNFQVSIWSKNIFDEDYYVNKNYYIGGHTVQDGAPRTIGTTLAYRF